MACLIAAIALLGLPVHAANSTWNGSSTTDWNTSGNWSGSSAPTVTNTAQFSSAFTNQPNVGTATSVGGIWATTGLGQNVVISGVGPLTIAGNLNAANGPGGLANVGILLDDTANHSLTISSSGTLSNSTSFIVNNYGTLTLSNALSIGTTNLTLGGANDNAASTISLTGGTTSSTGGLNFNTKGTINLAGSFLTTGISTQTAGTVNLAGSLEPSRYSLNGGTLNINGAGSLVVSGTGSNGVHVNTNAVLNATATNALTGTGAFAVAGGTAIITGANSSFSGTVQIGASNTVDNSSVSIGNASSLGTGAITWNGGTLVSSSSSPLTIANTLLINGSGGMVVGGANAFIFSGIVTEGSNNRPLTVNDTGGVTFSGGSFTLSTSNGSGMSMLGSGNITIADVVANGGTNGSILYGGTGTLTLTAANTYTGSTTFQNGTVLVDYSASGAPANNILNSSSLLTGDGGTLIIKGVGSSASNTQTVASLLAGAGASTINLNQNGDTTLTLAVTGTINHTAGATLNFSNIPSTSGIIVTASSSTPVDGSGIVGPWLTVGTGTNLNYATLNGSNQIVSYGAGATSAGSSLSGMTSATTNYTFSGTQTTTAGALTGNTLRYTGSGDTLTIGASGTLTLNGLMNAGTGQLTVAAGSATTSFLMIGGSNGGGTTKELDIITNNQNISIAPIIEDNTSGASVLSVSGSGSVSLLGANTYTGGTFLDSGNLNIANAKALGTGRLTIEGGTLSADASRTLINNNAETWAGSFSFGGAGGGTLNMGTGAVNMTAPNVGNTITITMGGTSSDTLTIGGVITGGNSNNPGNNLTINGANSKLTLSGSNVYLGYITVNGATLSVSADSNLSGSSGTVTVLSTSGQTATLSSSTLPAGFGVGSTFLGSTVTGVAGAVITVSGTPATISTSTPEGWASGVATILNGGTLQATSSFSYSETNATGVGATVNRALWLGPNGGTVDVTGSSNLTTPGVISDYEAAVGGGSLTKTDSGTLTLAGADTYTGNTTVSGGTLDLKNSLALQDSTLTTSGITFDSAATGSGTSFTFGGLSGSGNIALQNTAATAVALFVGNNNSTTTYSGVMSAGGSLVKVGTGALTLSNANTYSGGTSVTNGSLVLTNTGATSATGTGALSVINTATLAGTGRSTGNFTINGNSATNQATILAGMLSSTDTSTGTSLTLAASTGSITNAKLTFNLSTASGPASSQLNVANTVTTFGTGDVLSVNLVNAADFGGTSFTLIAGTAGNGDGTLTGSQYGGLTTTGTDTNGHAIISGVTLAFNDPTMQSLYGSQSYLFLVNAGGVDNIDVEVVPEPGTWALMLGGLALLVVCQRRRRSRDI